MQATIEQLKQEVLHQEDSNLNIRYRLGQVKDGNIVIKEELITLINLEETLKQELEHTVASYHNVSSVELQSKHKLKLLEDELEMTEEDVKLLTDEYIKENQHLREEELANEQLNT